MGLFDNLFLDANTPVTINDGVDRTKDTAMSVVDPKAKSSPVTELPPEESTKTPGSQDASLGRLFIDEEKKEAAATLSPEPPVDIALEIGQGGGQAAPSDVSFDIGGDLSFDIGGDVSQATGGSPIIGEIGKSDTPLESPNIVIEATHEDVPVPVSSGDSTSALGSGNPSDGMSPLFSLLNDPTLASGSNPVEILTEAITEAPHQENPVEAHEVSASLLDIIGSEVTPNPAPSAPEDITPSGGVLSEPIFSETSSPLTPDTTLALDGIPLSEGAKTQSGPREDSLPSFSVSSPLPELSRSPDFPGISSVSPTPKLRAKITEFLGELESLDLGDQADRDHKLRQIEMCETRIKEIRLECDARVHALQLEIQALRRDIESMNEEKTRIKNVIQTFQKELESA